MEDYIYSSTYLRTIEKWLLDATDIQRMVGAKDARETLDNGIKQTKYEKLQDIIIEDAPALFLYNPDYIYWVSAKIKGLETTKIVDPAKRFSNIKNWYIKTKRVWK